MDADRPADADRQADGDRQVPPDRLAAASSVTPVAHGSRSLRDLTWPVHTARLVVRPARAADAPSVFAYRSRPEVSRWMTRLPTDADAFARYWAENLDCTLALERGGVLVGDLMVKVSDGWSQAEVAGLAVGAEAELGWCLAQEVWGQGYGTEAVRALLQIAFDGLGVRRVQANCFAANTGSWAVMEKVGMRREGYYVGDSLHRDGTWKDGMTYALLVDEWRERSSFSSPACFLAERDVPAVDEGFPTPFAH